MMQVVWGSARLPAGSAEVTTSQRLVQNDAGQPLSWIKQAQVTAQLLTALGSGASPTQVQNDLLAQQSAVYRALSLNYRNFALLTDSGAVALSLDNATSLSGVRVVQGPDFPAGGGPEFAATRTVRFVVEAEYAVSGSAFLLKSFTERVRYSGGGQVIDFFRPVTGKAVSFTSYVEEYKCRQEGRAVGWAAYPTPPAAIFPKLLVRNPDYEKGDPEFKGNLYRNYPISWSYEFGSADPLPFAAPNFWPI